MRALPRRERGIPRPDSGQKDYSKVTTTIAQMWNAEGTKCETVQTGDYIAELQNYLARGERLRTKRDRENYEKMRERRSMSGKTKRSASEPKPFRVRKSSQGD